MRRFFKEGAYLKKKNYLRKYLDFKISKTKPITKEPSLVLGIISFRDLRIRIKGLGDYGVLGFRD